jgi:acyl dehydratase
MAIDRKSFIGHTSKPFSTLIEAGRLRFFAKAIGETNPIYFDEAAARAAGHRAIPAPPTFLFCAQMDNPAPYALYDEMGVRIEQVLHGEQSFTYHRPVYAGDRVTFQMTVRDVYEKKAGELGFIVRDTQVTNEAGDIVAVLSGTTVVRNRM